MKTSDFHRLMTLEKVLSVVLQKAGFRIPAELSYYSLTELLHLTHTQQLPENVLPEEAVQFLAGFFHLSARMQDNTIKNLHITASKEKLLQHFYVRFSCLHLEILYAFILSAEKGIHTSLLLEAGTKKKINLIPKDLLNKILPHFSHSSMSVLLLHNHPSGIADPSKEDILFTKHIQNSLISLNIPLYDHWIIGHNTYFSFKNQGLIL